MANNGNRNNVETSTSDTRSFVPSDEVFDRDRQCLPSSTINNINSGRNVLIIFLNSEENFNISIPQGDEMMVINFLFPCLPQDIKPTHLNILNNLMKELFVHYEARDDATEVSPGTMMGYMNGLNRIFKSYGYHVEILEDPVFVDRNKGFRQVYDNHIAKQQSRTMTTKLHNIFVLSDIEKVISHDVCSL